MTIRGLIKTIHNDYRRHGAAASNPAVWMLANYHFGRWAETLPPVRRKMGRAVYSVVLAGVEYVCNSRIYRETKIGEDLFIVHSGSIFIDPEAIIGDRVGIMHDVVIGTNMDKPGVPIIEDDVFIGAGARVLGPVRVGAGARIAANSLVIGDVPPGATAIGVPARVMRYTGATAKKPQAAAAKPKEAAKKPAEDGQKPAEDAKKPAEDAKKPAEAAKD